MKKKKAAEARRAELIANGTIRPGDDEGDEEGPKTSMIKNNKRKNKNKNQGNDAEK